jgi:hypothetical protein
VGATCETRSRTRPSAGLREIAPAGFLAQVNVLVLELVLEGLDLVERLSQQLLGAFAVHRVREDLAHQADPVDGLLVPGPVLAEGSGRDGADVAVPDGDRHGEVRLHAEHPGVRPLSLGFRGKLVQHARHRDHVAGRQRAVVPGQSRPGGTRRRRELQALPHPDVGAEQAAVGLDEEERAPIGAQPLGEQAQRALDLTVNGLDGQAREPVRQVRNQAAE